MHGLFANVSRRRSGRPLRRYGLHDTQALDRFSAPNPEYSKIRSTVGERALGGDFIRIWSAFFHSEARKVSRASSALNRMMVLPAGANFCKACYLMANGNTRLFFKLG